MREVRIALVLVLSGFVVYAFSQTYNLDDVDAKDGYPSTPYSINNVGQVVGYSITPLGWRAFIYANGNKNYIDFITPASDSYTYGSGINDFGEIVGGIAPQSLSTIQGLSYENGQQTLLGVLPGYHYSEAIAVNASGEITGFSAASSTLEEAHGFLLSRGTLTDLGTLGGRFSEPFAINNSGAVVGMATTGEGAYAAFLYSGGVMHNLGSLGTGDTWATSINNSQQIVGASYLSARECHPFLYSNGVMHDLGLLVPDVGGGGATGINDSGQIVGGVNNAADEPVGFVYLNGIMYDLNTLLSSEYSNYVITNTYGINNSGQIIASAVINGATHAVVLTPAECRRLECCSTE